jgi:hypothetical protein
MFWKGTESQLFETFAQAARALRSELAPGTAISGPSLSHYDRDYLARFVDFCKAKNVHLNVLSWHELAVDDNIPSIAEHLREARHLFVENSVYRSVGIERIEINEIIGPSAQYRPGEILGYFAALEKGGADGACKACWGDARGGSNCTNDTLDGILTPDTHEPRAAWWAYKAYADSIAGRVQANSSDPRLAVFASGSAAAGTAQVLVGCYPCPGLSTPNMGLAIRIQNLSRILGKARRAHVKVERLPDSGEKPLLAPEKGLEEDVALSSGGLTAAIPALALHEAYLVTISRLPG